MAMNIWQAYCPPRHRPPTRILNSCFVSQKATYDSASNISHVRPSLSVAGNELTALPENIGKAAMLRVIDIHGNILQAIPASIAKLRTLEAEAYTRSHFR